MVQFVWHHGLESKIYLSAVKEGIQTIVEFRWLDLKARIIAISGDIWASTLSMV
jgi:hypothetical protein